MEPAGLETLLQLHKHCQHNNHRGLVIISGEQQWSQDTAISISQTLPELCFKTINDAASAAKLLGDETDGIIFNAFHGLNLNALAISAGTIKGGGLLLLLCPELNEWTDFDDPEYKRLLAYPYTNNDVKGRFLLRFQQLLKQDRNNLILSQYSSNTAFTLPTKLNKSAVSQVNGYANKQQQQAVKQILSLTEKDQQALLITANRGRGKSAALGLAAAELLACENKVVLLTAPSPKAVKTVFKHAQNENTRQTKYELKNAGSRLSFISPDELLRQLPPADLVMIDEAAAIPLPVLLQILTQYQYVVMTTTVHGYEGTGRAFALRFGELLKQQKFDWTTRELDIPIRFSRHDPLEAFLHHSLILNCELANRQLSRAVEFSLVDRDVLLTNEMQLREIFGLLMLAHYKTRPDDLRHLLDAPNIDVFVLKQKQQIMATAMVAKEGKLEAPLIQAIMEGERRPKGHLLPQTLAFHCQIPQAASVSCARVIRIAVHPDLQRNMLGSQLLSSIEDYYQRSGCDLIGSSFGLEPGILAFWQQRGYDCVRVGHKRNAASGYRSGLLIKSLGQAGDEVCKLAVEHHQQQIELSHNSEDKR